MVACSGKPVYLLQTPDGSEGKSTLPTLDMPAGYEGAVIVSVRQVALCHQHHRVDMTAFSDMCSRLATA
jgi:hypothetical protein